MSLEEIVQQILSRHQEVTYEDVVKAIEKKKEASGGFLTDEAAARLIAAELGVEIDFKSSPPKIHIHGIVSGLNDVTVSGRVLLVNSPKVFSRPDGKGQVARLLIADKTGSLRVALWDDKAQLVKKTKLRDIVTVLHGYVRRSRRGEMELHIGQKGSLQVASPDVKENDFPPIENFLTRIASIEKTRKTVNIEGIIRAAYPVSTFARDDGTQGKVMRVMIEDKTGKIPVVFWNEKAESMADAREEMSVLLMNAKVKSDRDGLLELHVDDSANVERLKRQALLFIKDLSQGMSISSIEGVVASKPVVNEVSTRTGERVSVASFELEDSSGRIWVSAWRQHAETAARLPVGVEVDLRDVYVRKGFGGQLEISTRTSTEIEVKQ